MTIKETKLPKYKATGYHTNTKTDPMSSIQILRLNFEGLSEGSIRSSCLLKEIIYYSQGNNILLPRKICPIDTKWQKEKCKLLKLTFVGGVIYENQSSMKDFRQLAPS